MHFICVCLFFPLKKSPLNDFHWYPHHFFYLPVNFQHCQADVCGVSAGGPKDWGFEPWLASWTLPPPTEDHIHLKSEIDTQPKRRKPRWFVGAFYQETTRWPDIGQPLIWGDIFFSFLQPRIGTTARWSTHWSALDTSTTCPWIASPQNSVAEGIAWAGLR